MNNSNFFNNLKLRMNHAQHELAEESSKQYVEKMNETSMDVILLVLLSTTGSLYFSFYFSSLFSDGVGGGSNFIGFCLYIVLSLFVFIRLRINYAESYQNNFPSHSKLKCQGSIDDSIFLNTLFFSIITFLNCGNLFFIQFYETNTIFFDILISNKYYFYNIIFVFIQIYIAIVFYKKQVNVNDEIKQMFRMVNYANSFHKNQ